MLFGRYTQFSVRSVHLKESLDALETCSASVRRMETVFTSANSASSFMHRTLLPLPSRGDYPLGNIVIPDARGLHSSRNRID